MGRYYGARDRQPPSGVWTTEHYLVEEYDEGGAGMPVHDPTTRKGP